MNEAELKNEIETEYQKCNNEIISTRIEIAKLQGKLEELDDRRTMLFDLKN